MTSLQIYVVGLPKGQPRAKPSRRGGFIRMYTPDVADDWKGCVARAIADAVPKGAPFPLFSGPVRVDATFIFPRPKGHFRTNGDIKPNSPTWHTAKPDRDNCDKAVLDVFTQCQVFADDAQACDGRIMKRYAGVGEATGARIHILSLSDEG